jgi:hypothetical protein
MKAIAIDPGERVGWATSILTSTELTDIKQGVTPLKDFAMKLGKVAGEYDVIVYEAWRLYPAAAKSMIGNDMQPSQLVGMIRYFGWLNPQVKMVVQGANIKTTAEKTMPDWFKERMALSSEQHDQDALMHLWHYWWTLNVKEKSL